MPVVNSPPFDAIDMSDASLYQQDVWRPASLDWGLKSGALSENDVFGGFWSATRLENITTVDGNHEAFSSEPANTTGDYGDDLPVRQFIAMGPPLHELQRAAVERRSASQSG